MKDFKVGQYWISRNRKYIFEITAVFTGGAYPVTTVCASALDGGTLPGNTHHFTAEGGFSFYNESGFDLEKLINNCVTK